jgi:UDP-N-acetylglucosamine diphosphorylase / glucose-1-phosphate thymidylyltransferase / UDP-N-acetylgalactosamine diphosphorylase / glucosamine-1-phosphate N-acetyltransferase / galactosamine-1-phosphate N-acetyltransferase
MTVSQAVILAAGEGSRMRPLTSTRPKVMLPVANRPILEHLLLELKLAGIRDCILIVGYHQELVKNYFDDGSAWGLQIRYLTQAQPLGTADALRTAHNLINRDCLMVNGDVIIDHLDIQRFIAQEGNGMTVVELPAVTGLGVIQGADGRVKRICEKSAAPPSHLANAGLYRFTPEIFTAIENTSKSPRGEYEITDSIQNMIDAGIPVAYQQINQWWDLSYPWDLLTANEKILADLKSLSEGDIEPNVVLKNAVSVGQGTVIRSGAYIVGPVIIGRNCDIGPHCFIRPSTAIADNCHIGASVEVKNSIIMSGTKIPHFNYVGDSVIGSHCNLGAGTKIANLKLDKLNISVDGIDTGRHKLGAIIGDNVQTGINSSINVGTLIGANTLIGPGALAHGVIAPSSRIF